MSARGKRELQVRLPPDIRTLLVASAKRQGISLSAALAQAIEHLLYYVGRSGGSMMVRPYPSIGARHGVKATVGEGLAARVRKYLRSDRSPGGMTQNEFVIQAILTAYGNVTNGR